MIRRLFLVLAAFFGVGLFCLYLSLGRIVRAGIERWGPQLTQASVRVGSVGISPLSGRGHISNLVVGNPAGFRSDSAFKVRRIHIALDLRSLLTDTIAVRKIEIDDPEITYEVGLSGSNIGKLQRNIETYIPPSKSKQPGKKTVIDDISIRNGRIRLHVQALQETPIIVALPDIRLKDVGKKSGGATVQEAVAAVLIPLTGAIVRAVSNNGGALQQGAATISNTLNQALKNIFGR